MNLSQYNVEFHAGVHKGGKSYIRRIIESTRTAMLHKHKSLGHAPLYEELAKHVGLADEGMNDAWFETCTNGISQAIKRPEQLLWRRIGRFIQDNKCWPTSRMISLWPEYQTLADTKIEHGPLPPKEQRRRQEAARRRKAVERARDAVWAKEKQEEMRGADPQYVTAPPPPALGDLLHENRRLHDTILSMEQRILCLEDKLDDVWEIIDMATSPKANGRTWLGKILGEGAAEQKEER